MTEAEIADMLEKHMRYECGEVGGVCANLSGANLCRANLRRANLRRADLSEANLSGADLSGANLSGADLHRANLRGADLSGADLRRANLSEAILRGADLSGADLHRANLRRANLSEADLSEANLSGAILPAYQIPQEGELIVWKKLKGGRLAKLRIPPEAKRTASLIGRKCRAEYVEVLEGTGSSEYWPFVHYSPGCRAEADCYVDDPRVECSHGIHFFLTREEAERY